MLGVQEAMVQGGAGHSKTDPALILAVMVIIVVFVFVIFAIFAFKGKDHHRDGGRIEEIAALGLMASQTNKPHYPAEGTGHPNTTTLLAHDTNRDLLKGQAAVEKEIVKCQAESDAKTAKYFYETEKAVEVAKHENYKATVEQNEKTRELIVNQAERTREQAAQIERERMNNELRKQELQNLYLSLRGTGHTHARAFIADDFSALGAVAA